MSLLVAPVKGFKKTFSLGSIITKFPSFDFDFTNDTNLQCPSS